MKVETSRLYVITRKDLRKGLKIAQACHAAFELSKVLQEVQDDPYMIVLEVADEDSLLFVRKVLTKETKVVSFNEPDLGDQLTSLAFIGNERTKNITQNIGLAS